MKSPSRIASVALPPLADLAAKKSRSQVLATVRSWLLGERERMKERFLKSGDLTSLLESHTQAMDMLIASLFTLCGGKADGPVAVIATGGYGRKELFPYSDIDLLFLHNAKGEKEAARVAEYILYMLWDLGLTVGQAHRTTDETLELSRKDITICTTLLDARLLAGNEKLFAGFEERFEKEVLAGTELDFVEAKLAERDERHHRFGDSRYVLEPNIKEGKGGLRDLHTLWWLARYAYPNAGLKGLVKMGRITRSEYRIFDRARLFLCKARAHLHYIADRQEDRLTFDRQHALAVAMGYGQKDPNRTVERFMRRYFSAVRMVGEATRILCVLLEEEKKRKPRQRLGWLTFASWKPRGFMLEGERLSIKQPTLFERTPLRMIELFHISQAYGLDIHPRALQAVARNLGRIDRKLQMNPRANALFLDILLAKKGAEATLRRMSDAGVLGRFIPDFGRVIGQTQFNMYHVYTVDEHTLVAIGILHAIENGELKKELPHASSVFERVTLKQVLYVALFCHDIAKGRGGDHSAIGAKVARKLAERFGFSEDETDITAWLVENHLLFSATAFKRDLNEPRTIQDFVQTVRSPERLKLLLLLTIADMRAVGASVWNAWKASLIEELFARAEQAMASGQSASAPAGVAQLREALMKHLPGWSAEQLEAYLAEGTPNFLNGVDAPCHAAIARMLRQAEHMPHPLLLDTDHDYELKATQIIVCTPDRKGLFSSIAGAMALAGANIASAQIFTLKNGMAIDIFHVQDAAADVFDRPDRLAKLSVYIEQALAGELDLAQTFAEQRRNYGRSRRDAHPVSGQVFIENDASALHTVIEITGHDRLGFLYQVTKAISELGLSIATAHITTYGTQVADVFYVKDSFGHKVVHEARQQTVRESLLQAINNPERA